MPDSESVTLLRSIDATLRELLSVSKARRAAPSAASAASAGPSVAPDSDLDGQWGNEKVKADPRDWSGPSFKGRLMNECPPDFLDQYAGLMDFFAEKNTGMKTDKGADKSAFDRRSGARARGWAKRLRGGWKPPQVTEPDWGGEPQEDFKF